LATVATHAALNSCITFGDEVTGSSLVTCFVLAHEFNNRAKQIMLTAVDNLGSMIYFILKGRPFKDRIKKVVVYDLLFGIPVINNHASYIFF
jgi:hypothetical protein